ncbi:glycoside hydrolase family 78 protein [Yinghuangia sp. ASG 101]|uniref:alpha-L-rhamnosidase n=1 Tax=Yinghuangia sp. ASG 101 TaxID=2896848 RepID=UPI001E4A4C1A|nr:alpha-L-rhamnosidase [Yinghuangia sp. ASG 101]UGQ12243.1 glycoside hydrolase family 78 protein [Yinghuangia sp. ASG 101]
MTSAKAEGRFVTPSFALEPDGEAPYFRREFTVDTAPERALLHVTALGIVEPYVNGERVGDEVLAPGWTSYRHRVVVSTHDVTALITPGANVLGAIVGEGWAVGRIGFAAVAESGENADRFHYAERPALFARLELTYADHVDVIATDESFQCATGAVLAHSLYDGETYDARREPDGWHTPGFDAAGWTPAVVYPWDPGTLVPRTAEPIRRVEELAPVSVTTSPSGRTIVDFGQNLAGWIRLTTTGEAGRTVTLRHAEILTPDGELDPTSLRTAACVDRYTLRGGGTEIWEPRFTFHGFRYAEIDGPFDEVAAVVVHSDMPRTGWLETSHELVDRFHANAVWSMRGNFVGLPTDCPQRDERMGWTGDIHAFAPAAAFLYDVRGVLGSWLDDLAAEQREKGSVPVTVPDVLGGHLLVPTALWGDVAVALPWILHREYGDPAVLRRAYPSMTAFVHDVEKRLDAEGLWSQGFQFGDWLDPDAPDDDASGGKTDKYLVACAYFAKTTRIMADTARILGETEDAAHFAALDTRVREAFRREFVTPAGRVAGESATAYALAIAFDLLTPEQEAKAGARLAEVVTRAKFAISTGFAGTPLVLPALSKTGHLDEAYRLLLRKRCPSFLYPVTQGATTIWERWDAIRPDGTMHPAEMTSFNHYALGSAVDWLHRTVGGLTPEEPGYRRMRVAPRPGPGLDHAALRHITVHGEVRVSWRVTGTRMDVGVTIPPGTTATVVLPAHPDAAEEHVDAGTHAWSYDLPDGFRPQAGNTLDTPLPVLVGDPDVWPEVAAVFAARLPQVPIAHAAKAGPGTTLRTVLDRYDADAATRDAVSAALGEPTPETRD